MPSDDIKSGAEVISEFLSSLSKDDKAMDQNTLQAIQSLHDAKRLTRSQLLQALEALRARAVTRPAADNFDP